MELSTKRREIAYMLGAHPVQSQITMLTDDQLVTFGGESYRDEMWSIVEHALSPERILCYEKNYNLLISAVEFIESLGYKVSIELSRCRISRLVPHYFQEYNEGTKRESIFEAVAAFAANYNVNRTKEKWEG